MVGSALNFHPSRIAITGGSGFVGSAIAKRLLMENIPQVVLLSRRGQLPPSLQDWRRDSRLSAVACDIRDRESLLRALMGCDAVFHQAAGHSMRPGTAPGL